MFENSYKFEAALNAGSERFECCKKAVIWGSRLLVGFLSPGMTTANGVISGLHLTVDNIPQLLGSILRSFLSAQFFLHPYRLAVEN